MDNKIVVSEYQGIDVEEIKSVLNEKDITPERLESVKAGMLELIEHVESDGLLQRVADAREHMAEQDAGVLRQSQY